MESVSSEPDVRTSDACWKQKEWRFALTARCVRSYRTILASEARCAPPVASLPAGDAPSALNPVAPLNRFAGSSLAERFRLSLHPSKSRAYRRPSWLPLAGPGAFPLHRHRTMEERPPFQRAQVASKLPESPWPTVRRLDAANVLPLDRAWRFRTLPRHQISEV